MKWIGYWTRHAAAAIELGLQGTDEETVEFAVLNLTKMIYTLDCDAMTTKERAGTYALQALPSDWHNIIHEALRIRRAQGEPSLYETGEQRVCEAKRFVTYVIDYCNRKHPLF